MWCRADVVGELSGKYDMHLDLRAPCCLSAEVNASSSPSVPPFVWPCLREDDKNNVNLVRSVPPISLG